MFKRVLSFIQSRTSWIAILISLAVAAALMFTMNGAALPFSNPTIEDFSGGVPILDMRFLYTPDDANELFTALGEKGRAAYRTLHLGPDALFPIAYSLAFAFLAAWFLVRLFPIDHPAQWLSLIPLISGLADILENLTLVILGVLHPSRVDWLAWTASFLTRIKFGLLPIGTALLMVMVVLWFAKRRPSSNVQRR